MVQSPVSVHIDGLNTDSFAMPSTYRLPPGKTVGIAQRPLDWLEWVWGVSAIEVIVNPCQGVSETWWRVFKAQQTR